MQAHTRARERERGEPWPIAGVWRLDDEDGRRRCPRSALCLVPRAGAEDACRCRFKGCVSLYSSSVLRLKGEDDRDDELVRQR